VWWALSIKIESHPFQVAIADERFYILTDLNVLPQIHARMENILNQKLPDFS